MRPVTVRTADLKNIIINLGFVGENEHRQIRFDAKKDFEEYPHASASLTVVPPEGESYPAIIERDGDYVLWTITDSDVIGEGDGEIQLAFTEGEVVKRTCIARTKTDRSLVPTGSIPSGIDDFITRAGTLLEQVEETFPAGGTTGQVLAKKSDADYDTEWVDQGGGGGTSDYEELDNLPQIGGVTLKGNKTLHDLGAAAESDIPDVSGFYTKPADGIPASDMASGVIPVLTDLIDDTAGDGVTNKVWSADKSHELLTEINSKYTKPQTGIPSSDMTDAVQTSLGKADRAYQKPSGGIPGTDLADSYIKEPSSDGTNGQVLTTDGNGGRSWTTVQGGGGGVSDVQVNGTSVVSQGVANIPKATDSVMGVAKFSSGLFASSSGTVTVNKASGANIKAGTEAYKPIVPSNQNEAVFYGLAKLAGYDMKNDSSAVGTYPAQAIDAILQMLGVFDLIAQHETTPSTHAYAQGECFIFNGKLCRATTAISVADTITIGTNCEQTTLIAEITR